MSSDEPIEREEIIDALMLAAQLRTMGFNEAWSEVNAAEATSQGVTPLQYRRAAQRAEARLNRLRRRIETGADISPTPWKSVPEIRPAEGGRYLVRTDQGVRGIVRYDPSTNDWYVPRRGNHPRFRVVAWMELP